METNEETGEDEERENQEEDLDEDQEEKLGQLLAQTQTGKFRTWLKDRRYERALELQTLENVLEVATEGIQDIGKWNDNIGSAELQNLRAYLDIQRRKRDILREERDDLKWLWELEHREFILERRANRPEPQEKPNENRRSRQYTGPKANEKPKWNFKKPKPKP